jgi:hypothetical protein
LTRWNAHLLGLWITLFSFWCPLPVSCGKPVTFAF